MRLTDHDSAHVIPCGDLVEHVTDPDCPCGPTTELIQRDGRPDGYVYAHHALDGRQ